jgi:predicted nucleic acid-binding protein
MKTHVLDANALYRFLHRGPGFETVRLIFKEARRAETDVLISVINWGEVHYTIVRQLGIKSATASLREVQELPLKILDADLHQTRLAAELKASYGLPYADCFAAALTGKAGMLVTADIKDFKKIPWLQLTSLPPHTI